MSTTVVGIVWGISGFVVASFFEYWGHRFMHKAWLVGQIHRNHHRTGVGQGVLLEYWDYFKWGILFMLLPLLISWRAGIGWFLGANLFTLFSAFAHQLQHDNPQKCFWMRMPIHYVHHRFQMWHDNFGVAVDWWDRIFCTYKPVEITKWREGLDPALAHRSIFQIRW